ncbi:MAG: hypothetical protein ABIK78_07135 [candidate division WOR-3 bacterium]
MHPIIAIFLILFFGLPILFFTLLVLKIVKKVRGEEWRGEIIDKVYNVKVDKKIVHPGEKEKIFKEKKNVQHLYTLVVKTDSGQIRKVAVTKEMYDSCQIGDKLVKPKGALNPKKL